MRQVLGAACGLVVGLSGAALAQSQSAVVVELYTSQGCSACPPADAFMAELAKDPRVIALALHVDYWDYIGWEDEFGQAAFTSRQKAYAKAAGSRMIYTPQFIVDGQDQIEGNRPEAMAALVQRHAATVAPVTLSLSRNGDTLAIHAEADPPLATPVRVQVVRYRPAVTIDIKRGENAGKTVEYSNIVTSWETLADWSGQTPLEVSANAAGDDAVVVILQKQGPAEIVAAARLD